MTKKQKQLKLGGSLTKKPDDFKKAFTEAVKKAGKITKGFVTSFVETMLNKMAPDGSKNLMTPKQIKRHLRDASKKKSVRAVGDPNTTYEQQHPWEVEKSNRPGGGGKSKEEKQ